MVYIQEIFYSIAIYRIELDFEYYISKYNILMLIKTRSLKTYLDLVFEF